MPYTKTTIVRLVSRADDDKNEIKKLFFPLKSGAIFGRMPMEIESTPRLIKLLYIRWFGNGFFNFYDRK